MTAAMLAAAFATLLLILTAKAVGAAWIVLSYALAGAAWGIGHAVRRAP